MMSLENREKNFFIAPKNLAKGLEKLKVIPEQVRGQNRISVKKNFCSKS